MAKKKSASQLAAEMAYFKENNITFEVKAQKPNSVSKAIIEKTTNSNAQPYGLGNSKELGIYIEGINTTIKQVQFTDDKIVVEEILNKYEFVLNKIKGIYNTHEIKEYLKSQNCHQGICFFSRRVFGYRITDCWWVKQFSEDGFWTSIPLLLFSSKEIFDSFEFRINKLKEILNSFQ